jgi:hypothetical protein
MKATSSKWIEAAKTLGANPNAIVRCPEHDDDILLVREVDSPSEPGVFDRYLTCRGCGAHNLLIRMRRHSG